MAATLIDSNAIIDVVEPNSAWAEWAKARIADARIRGPMVFNIVIAAEVAHEFRSRERYLAVFDPAAVAGHRLLTRDPARYRTYFPSLEIIAPDTDA